MHELDELEDHALLRQYAEHNSGAAFAALVTRHVDKVYSTALRHTRNPHAAEEITQAVFVILAKKSGRLGAKVILAGWLYETARLTALTHIRSEIRRARREQEAHMQTALNEHDADAWPHIAPLLDDALAKLSAADRHAIVLRYFDGKSLGEVGAALGASEDAAKKRVTRAVEKLRGWFTQRGVTLTATVLTAAISANSVQAAPVGLAKTISVIAITKGAVAGGSTLALVKGVMKIMAWTKMKMAIVVGVSVLLTAGTATVIVETISHPKLSATDLSWANDPKYWEINSQVLGKLPPVYIFRPTQLPYGGSMMFRDSESRQYKRMGRQCEVKWLVTVAYDGRTEARCVYPPDMPTEKYDFMFTLPEDFHPKLKAELNSRFGLTAHVEKRIVESLLLKVKNPTASGLKVSDGKRNDWIGGQYEAKIHGEAISGLTGWLETSFAKPVFDRTGLSEKFDLNLNWKPLPGQSEKDAIQEMLLNQLGLELVPSREPVEMLVVEKVK